ncbi:hypothetical protein ACFCX4_07395 [Kitasatospora sp. NPDC056327]|uniref:hypothetical protein n=1 Tax=Kitasatospora sp. NPDC056327 TaxID=3345785 RepID=UPI0035D622D3
MTAPLSSPDPTTGPHPSVDELADLAEDLLDPVGAGALRQHLTGCAECRETVDALAGIAVLLGGAEPPAVPADVAARIDAALAAEADRAAGTRDATAPAAAPTAPLPGAVPAPPAPSRPGAPPAAPPSRPAATTGPGRPGRPRRRRALLLGSAAALLVLGLGGTFLALSSSPGGQDTAMSSRAAATAAPENPESKADREPGGTVYREEQLAGQVRELLARAGSGGPALPGEPSAGTGAGAPPKGSGATAVPPADGEQGLTGGRSAPACPALSTAPLLVTELGSYAGAPAELLVHALPGRPDRLDVYLRAADCGPLLLHRTVPAG